MTTQDFTLPLVSAPSSTFDADSTLVLDESPARRWFTRFTIFGALIVYLAYLAYRAKYTINHDALVFSCLVYFAELHGFFSLAFYFHTAWTRPIRKVVEPVPDLKVDVFITTFNEDVDLLRTTVRAAVGMRYAHRTFVLDDGRRPAVRAMAEELGALYLTRQDNAHAKAGNWNNAFALTDAEFIATFDADHVPRPEFLDRTLGFFRDPKVALVQVPQQYHNLDSVQHKVSWRQRRMYGEQDAFFQLVMPGKDNWNAAFFCGTGAVLRRDALTPFGGIKTQTITEDLHTSVELHSRGWKSVYLNEVLVTGLAPSDLKTFETQRLRWAEGNMTVATFINPLTARGLSMNQRIAYAASLFHWTIGIPKFIFYMAPPWMLFTGTFPIAPYNARFLVVYLVFLSTVILSYEVASRGKGRLLMDELYNMVSFFTFIRAMKRVMFGRGARPAFEVTDKRGAVRPSMVPVLPHMAILLFSMLAIGWSLMGLGFRVSDDYFGAGTGIFWTLYNMSLMLVVLRLASRPGEKRTGLRFRANFPVEAQATPGNVALLGVTADISDTGCSLLWPRPLAIGSRLAVRVHLGPRPLDVELSISSAQKATDDGWYRYGAKFDELSQADIDLITDSIHTIAVPHLFRTLSRPPLVAQLVRKLTRPFTMKSGRAKRQLVRIPVRLEHEGREWVVIAVDISATGMSVLMPINVSSGSRMFVSMSVPGHAWSGEVSVARSTAWPSRNGFDVWLLGLQFEQKQSERDIAPFRMDAAA
jgi:cellulose synthase (UDP-forming)